MIMLMVYLRECLRFLLIRKHASKLPTGLIPLSEVKTVVVFLDYDVLNCELARIAVTEFFTKAGKKVQIVSRYDRNLITDSDLFLSLDDRGRISERYAATCSRAMCKVGRKQLKRNIYDIVITDGPDPQRLDHLFESIVGILGKVK